MLELVEHPATKKTAAKVIIPNNPADTHLRRDRKSLSIAAILCGLNCFREKEEIEPETGPADSRW
jgi:hypothetical protein